MKFHLKLVPGEAILAIFHIYSECLSSFSKNIANPRIIATQCGIEIKNIIKKGYYEK